MSSLMIDVQGTALTSEDKELISHPKVGGLILFTRNFESVEQLIELNKQIKSVKSDTLIAVDHEGGRVQRFREGFSKIPAMGSILASTKANSNSTKEATIKAANIAKYFGYIMAAEVQAVGIDISFAPVLDIDDVSDVIGDRGFSNTASEVVDIAASFMRGMHLAGMKTTGKHFPGHGGVKEDSHVAMAVDARPMSEIFSRDLMVFKKLIDQRLVNAMMPAHVIYPNVDDNPVGFSSQWLQQILRKQLGFDGVIFSDDLSMKGATGVGNYQQRCEIADQAGCDMLLVCNDRQGAIEAIEHARLSDDEMSKKRVLAMLNTKPRNFSKLASDSMWSLGQTYLR
mgnify:CR=1 FL=1